MYVSFEHHNIKCLNCLFAHFSVQNTIRKFVNVAHNHLLIIYYQIYSLQNYSL